MTFYDRLEAETADARAAFMALPTLRDALTAGVSPALYVDYLSQAYHHVRHTCPLLAAAASRCGPEDGRLAAALYDYMAEERGHDEWILDDIRAVAGADRAADTAAGDGDPPVRALVGYMYSAIERTSPYAVLGMVYVLEGTSVAIASQAAAAIAASMGNAGGAGFTYLTSHGALDREHMTFYRDLVNGIDAPAHRAAIVDAAQMTYYLWGQMFRALAEKAAGDGKGDGDDA